MLKIFLQVIIFYFVVCYLIAPLVRAVIKFFEDREQSQYFRGVQFAKEQIEFYNGDQREIWHVCDHFSSDPFERGMADELTRQGIRHPLDPLGELSGN